MATDYTKQWIQFFTGCGIPDDIAATYGLIFNKNRIQKNMLLDLNKEYLRDMGITIMGDIIAILRHAKVVHDKYIREQVLSDCGEKIIKNNELADQEIKKTTSVKRFLEHYTRKYENSELGVPQENVQIQIENDNSSINVHNKLAHHLGAKNKVTVKKKIEAPSVRSSDLVPVKPVVPVPKVRRVLPENEGNYKIKMPSGTTERSKKILEKAKLKQSKTVFDRLGESSVSSTSDVPAEAGTMQKTVKQASSKEKNMSSVFARLGEKSPLVTSTSSNGDSAAIGEQLPYRGILKTKDSRKKLRFSPGRTMRADKELRNSNARDLKLRTLRERLGTKANAVESSPPNDTIKLNRLQITTTFEEEAGETESSQAKTLSTRFKYMNTSSRDRKKEKNTLERLEVFRSETIQSKSGVSSTTQLLEARNRGIKRRLEDKEPIISETTDAAQSKRVRFGRTTQRLIPGNPESSPTAMEYKNLTMMVGKQGIGTQNSSKFALKSGIGSMNSDKMRRKFSLKERIGSGSIAPKSGRTANEIKLKPSLKLPNRIKKNAISIQDRLG